MLSRCRGRISEEEGDAEPVQGLNQGQGCDTALVQGTGRCL